MSTKSSKSRPNPVRERMKRQAARDRVEGLQRPPSVFEGLSSESLREANRVTFPVGHCYPPAAEGAPAWPVVVNEAGEWSQVEPDR